MLVFAIRLACIGMILEAFLATDLDYNVTSTGVKLNAASETSLDYNKDETSMDKNVDIKATEDELAEKDDVSNNIHKVLSKVIGKKYASCEKRHGCKGMCVSKLPCLCDNEKCGLIQNCCPDAEPVSVLQSISNKPLCIQLHDLFYTQGKGNSITLNDKNHQTPIQTLNSTSAQRNEFKSTHHDRNLTSTNDNTYVSSNSTNNGQVRPVTTQQSELLRIQTAAFPFYWVFNSCPSGFTDTFTKDMCEKEFSDEIKDIVPVVSWTGIIYKNRFCARCHNETYTKSWQVITNCMHMYTYPSLPNTLSEMLTKTRECLVLLEPFWISGILSDASICRKSLSEDHVISSTEVIGHCKTTDPWSKWNDHISRLCESLDDMRVVPDKRNSTLMYKNIFCYICNTDGTKLEIAASGINYEDVFTDGYVRMEVEMDKGTSPRLVMLGSNEEEPYPCPRDKVSGVYKEGCLNLRCPLDSLPTNGLCLTNNRDVKGLVASATIQLTPMFNSDANEYTLGNATFHIMAEHLIAKLATYLHIKTNKCDFRYAEVLRNSETREHVIFIKISNTMTCSTSVMVTMFKPIAVDSASITVRDSFGRAQRYAVRMYYDKINRTQYDSSVKLIDKNWTYEFSLDRKFYCPSIGLNVSSISFLSKTSSIRKIIEGHQQQNLTTGGDLIHICLTEYLEQWVIEKYNLRPQDADPTETVDIPSVLTLITSIISMTSTVVVIITYSLFSELRCIPGKLFMALCLNILISQCSFVFGISSENPSSVWCKVAGALIHVFWLSTIFAMHSCLWLMYRTISHPLQNDYLAMINSDSNLFALCYTLPCYVLPALLSTINILVSTFLYSDRYHGYGGAYCFISIPRMKIFTFIVPICLVLAVNCVLFGLIMFNIRNAVVRTNTKSKHHEQITAFFKLSTMTGVFWLFGVLYEASGFKVFEYLFIILNGGQGFLLMWSFLLNKRVFSMFQSMYYRYAHRPHDSLSLSNSSSSLKQDKPSPSPNQQETSDV